MYVEVLFFKDGFFERRSEARHSRYANDLYNSAKIKFLNDGYEVIICLRNDDHTLISSSSNLTEIKIKSAGGRKVKKAEVKKIGNIKERAARL